MSIVLGEQHHFADARVDEIAVTLNAKKRARRSAEASAAIEAG